MHGRENVAGIKFQAFYCFSNARSVFCRVEWSCFQFLSSGLCVFRIHEPIWPTTLFCHVHVVKLNQMRTTLSFQL